MARRHEDRKPGQRFSRAGKASGSKPAKQQGKQAAGKSGGDEPAKKKRVAKKASTKLTRAIERAAGLRSKQAPARRTPARGSTRKAEGLIVKPSSVFGGASKTADGKVRLNHFLAKAGVCSRRNADELIATGRVEVNGEVITELGVRVDPVEDDVRFDGSRLHPEKAVYVLLNKPKGVVCTNAAHEQKKRVVDLLPTIRGRVFTVGRLDMDSEGLLLVTNDGAFAQEMTHPRFGISKLYAVVVRGRIEDEHLDKARGGVWLSEGPTGGMQLKIDRMTKERTFLKVTLREGKNREIRRVFAKLGYPVASLKRVRIGNLTLHGLGDGDWRFLQLDEVARLRELARSEHGGDGAEQAPPAGGKLAGRKGAARKPGGPRGRSMAGRKPLPPKPASRRKATRTTHRR
ncbi:MAG: rRNA pseudouridine synthase [Planctomycetes bacterium]|nr:rRNA pseudouridine synthase [Planctomycetota bacterium]